MEEYLVDQHDEDVIPRHTVQQWIDEFPISYTNLSGEEKEDAE